MKQKDPKSHSQKQAPGEETFLNNENITELTEEDLEQVSGGEITQDITVNKAKTADKAFNAMDGYIRQ